MECICVERTVHTKRGTTEALHRLLISIHRSRTADIRFTICITVPLTPKILAWRSWQFVDKCVYSEFIISPYTAFSKSNDWVTYGPDIITYDNLWKHFTVILSNKCLRMHSYIIKTPLY